MKTQKIILWAGVILTALIFGSAGAMKAFGEAAMHQRMADLHYPSWFTYLLGISEVIGVVALFFSKTRMWVVVFFQAILFGGIAAHLTAEHGLDKLIFALVGLVGLALIVFTNKKVTGNSFSI